MKQINSYLHGILVTTGETWNSFNNSPSVREMSLVVNCYWSSSSYYTYQCDRHFPEPKPPFYTNKNILLMKNILLKKRQVWTVPVIVLDRFSMLVMWSIIRKFWRSWGLEYNSRNFVLTKTTWWNCSNVRL